MSFRSDFLGLVMLAVCSLSISCRLGAQQPEPVQVLDSAPNLPDAPQPQFDAVGAQETAPAAQPGPAQSSAAKPGQSSSSSQDPVSQPPAQKTEREKAEEQIRAQERQRVLGVVPNFNISYLGEQAVSLTAGEKIKVAFRSAVDPVTFGVAAVVAGYGEVADSDSGFPWGPDGYFERAGAKYLDAFDGTMIGNGFLPALLHQDPRYFRLGHGSKMHRLLYSMATTVICKHDNSRRWEPNVSNIGGNILSGWISNLYYPGNDSGIGLTIGNGLIVTSEGTIGGIFDEFWPDISRKIFHRDPTHGLDAQAQQNPKAKQPVGAQK